MDPVLQQLVWWFGLVAAAAAAVKGADYLWQKGREGQSKLVAWWDERSRERQAMAELTADSGWPNGSTSMKESHQALYDRVATVEQTLAAAEDRIAGTVQDLENRLREDVTHVEERLTNRIGQVSMKLDDALHQMERLITGN